MPPPPTSNAKRTALFSAGCTGKMKLLVEIKILYNLQTWQREQQTITSFSNLSQIGHTVFEKLHHGKVSSRLEIRFAVERFFVFLLICHYIDQVNEEKMGKSGHGYVILPKFC